MARRAEHGKKGSSGFPLSGLFDVASAGRESLDAMDGEVHVRVRVGAFCDRSLALAAKDALTARRAGGIVEVMGLAGAVASASNPDAVIVLVGPGEQGVFDIASRCASAGVPCGIVAESALDVPSLGSFGDGAPALISASDPSALAPKLAGWLARSVPSPVTLAANFPFCRDAAVGLLTSRCAAENAAVGAIPLIPGSDYPIMCINQAKLALDIAACYGRGVELSRMVEVGGVLGAGLAYRSIARFFAGLVPGLGWALKAGMGYAGTVATAKAVQARFDPPVSRHGRAASSPEGSEPAPGPSPEPSRAASALPCAPSRRARSRAEADCTGADSGYLVIPVDDQSGASE